MRVYSRFIPSEEINAVSEWQFGSITDTDASAVPASDPQALPQQPDAELLDELRQQAYADGLAQGRQEAAQLAQQQVQQYIASQGQQTSEHLQRLVFDLQQRLGLLEKDLAQSVLELSMSAARQVVRAELALQPTQVLAAVKEAVSMLMADQQPVTVRLNPEDFQRLSAYLDGQEQGHPMRWVSDSDVAAGGCLVECAGTQVDGTLAKRWQRVTAALGMQLQHSEVGDVDQI